MITKQDFADLASDILILDGATGSNLHALGMPRGVCAETWILDNPSILQQTIGAEKQIQNHEVIKFDIARGSGWGTITHFGLYKGGTLVFWDQLTSPVQVPANTIPVFDIGALIIGIDKDELDPPNPTPPTD